MHNENSKLIMVIFAASGLLGWGATPVTAGKMVDYVPTSLLATNGAPVEMRPTIWEFNPAGMKTLARSNPELTTGDRWNRFETEFGLHNKNPSFVRGSLESAKYQLDRASFAIQEFTHNIEQSLKFDYGIADLIGAAPYNSPGPRPLTGNLVHDSLEQVRFKSDVRLNAVGESFVGVKLEMPFGD